MRIRVEPDVLRGLSGQLQHAAEQIQQLTVRLEQALMVLDLDVSARESVWNQWRQAKQLSEHINTYLHTHGTGLGRKAEQFQTADHSYQTILSSVATPLGKPVAMLNWAVRDSSSILPVPPVERESISNPQSVMSAIAGTDHSYRGDAYQDILRQASEDSPQDWRFADPAVVRDEQATFPG